MEDQELKDLRNDLESIGAHEPTFSEMLDFIASEGGPLTFRPEDYPINFPPFIPGVILKISLLSDGSVTIKTEGFPQESRFKNAIEGIGKIQDIRNVYNPGFLDPIDPSIRLTNPIYESQELRNYLCEYFYHPDLAVKFTFSRPRELRIVITGTSKRTDEEVNKYKKHLEMNIR